MTLTGFHTASWMGWLTGIYFVQKPWGIPKPVDLSSFYSLFSVSLWLIVMLFFSDLHMKTRHLFSDMSLVNDIMCRSIFLGFSMFDVYFRIILLIKKNKIPLFLARLERKEFSCCSSQNFEGRVCRRVHTRVQWFLLIPRLLSPLIILVWYWRTVKDNEWFIIQPPWYFVLFFFLGELPGMFSIIFVYDLIVTTTFELLQAIIDFCASVDDIIVHRKQKGSMSDLGDISLNSVSGLGKEIKLTDVEIHHSYENRRASVFAQSIIDSEINVCSVTKAILEKFENLKELSENYDDVNGYLILGVLVRSVFMIIHSLASIIITPKRNYSFDSLLKLCFDGTILIVETSQLMLLFLGSAVKDTVSQWKEKIKKRVVLMEDDEEKVHMRDLISFVDDWKWTMTAAGLFIIEKTTLCGILTTTLSYVVLICQLRLSNDPATFGNDTLHWEAENATADNLL